MTEIETTINDAIEGGWNNDMFYMSKCLDEISFGHKNNNSENNPCHYQNIHKILLDPKFWQAVEKHYDSSASNAIILARAKHHAGIFMSNLMEGGSIEDVLKQLYENRTRKNKG